MFVAYTIFKLEKSWHTLTEKEKLDGRAAFLAVVDHQRTHVTTYAYTLTGLKAGADMLLWSLSAKPDAVQEFMRALLQTSLGKHLTIAHSYIGIVKSYSKADETQGQGSQEPEALPKQRDRYLIIYPFTKTSEWYLLDSQRSEEMMEEHKRIAKQFHSIRQVLAYSFGIDDHEFILAYEANTLEDFLDVVRALRKTQVRRYTLKDTPVFVGIHRPLREAIEMLG